MKAIARGSLLPAALILGAGFGLWLVLGNRSPLSAQQGLTVGPVFSLAAQASPYDWLQYNGNPQHSGNNAQEAVLGSSNVAQLAFLFQATLPSIADGAPVYLASVSTTSGTHDLLFVTTKAGHIIALDAATGAQIWLHQYGPGTCKINNGSSACYTTSHPAIDPDRQYVYSYGLDGYVHKYQVGDGTEITTGGWPELATTKGFDEKGSSALAIATAVGGASYLYMTNGGYPGDNGDYQGHVTAINLADGSQKVFNAICSDQTVHFVHSPGAPDCAFVQSAIWARVGVVYDDVTDRIYMGTGNAVYDGNTGGHEWGDSVFSLNPDGTGSGGKPLDSYTPVNFAQLDSSDADLGSTAPAILPAPGYAGRLAVQGGKDALLRLINLQNLSGQGGPGHTGGEIQVPVLGVPQGGQVLTAPAVWINPADSSTWVFVVNGSGSSGLRLTVSGGVPSLATQWHNTSSGFSPLVANNVLYFAGSNIIRAVNPLTGALLWSDTTHVGGNHWESPIVVNATLYITDQSSHLTAYALPPAGSPTPTDTPTRTSTPTSTRTFTVTVQPTLTQTVTVPPTLTKTPTPTPSVLSDLVISSVNVPSMGGAGQTIKVTDTTHNKSGTGPAGPSTTRYYLSTDTTLDASDTLLGSRSIPALQPGASSKGSVNVVLPSGTSPGTRYVIAKADADNAIPETNESNNTSSDKIVIGPDLIVSSFSAPSSSGAGFQISVTDTTKNQGGGSTLVSSTTSFYLSTDSTLGAGDTLLGSRTVGVLAAGASSTQTTMLTIPAATPPGSYSIIARADNGGAVAETIESNNTKADSIKLNPDLIVSSLTVPASAGAGSVIAVSDTTRNQGNGSAAATKTKFYLSTDATFQSGSDTLLGSRDVPILTAGQSNSSPSPTSLTIPAGTAPGNYYILARADADNTVAESSESNNTIAKPITITL